MVCACGFGRKRDIICVSVCKNVECERDRERERERDREREK
jgi:hypothetical protein